jgi:hypothetical protein
MENATNRFDKYVIKIILAQEEYGFTEVNELEYLKSIQFDYDKYPLVKQQIEEGHWEQIEGTQHDTNELRMYLIVVRFKDQNGKTFIATIYDSDALEQDPQIIDIFLL